MRRMLAALLLVVFAAAAVEAATISGLVSDSTGGALINARVVLRDIATGQEQQVTTSSDGRYRFDAPAAGTYLLIVSRRGLLRSGADDRPRARRADGRSRRDARDRAAQRRGHGHRRAQRARAAAGAAAHRDAHQRRHRADERGLHRRRDGLGRERHAGRQRPVRRPAAPARARLDAPAGARGRRAAQHRAHGHRSHRRRGRPDLARRRSIASRSSTAPAR